MIVYNLTIQVDNSIHAAWLQWHKDEFIHAIMSSGQFTEYKFFRLLDQDEQEGPTYITQFFTPSAAAYKKFNEEFAYLLQRKAFEKWGNHFVSFNTAMEVVR
jgi:Domain of unknown function (DUF4286)